MISTTVIVACRGAKRWFDLDAVRTEHTGHGTGPDGVKNRERDYESAPGNRSTMGDYSNSMSAGAPPLDWHVDGITTSPPFEPREGTMSLRYIVGDTRDITATIPDGSVDVVCTSPPFLGLRSYLAADHPDKHREIGSEPNPAAFIDTLLELTAEWGRVLAPHGTLAVELGDTYSGANESGWHRGERAERPDGYRRTYDGTQPREEAGWPLAKSLAGIPQLYMIALAYGINPLTGQPSPAGRWRVRNVIAWHRPNPPVGALGDKWRPASSSITVACKGQRRWFDLDAVRGAYSDNSHPRTAKTVESQERTAKTSPDGNRQTLADVNNGDAGAPPLDWHTDGDLGTGHIILSTQPYAGSHYATFPMELPRKIIDCMCPRQVCRVCGVPRERVVDVSFTPHGERKEEAKGYRTRADGTVLAQAQSMANGRATKNVETLGWTDCGHDNYRPGLTFDPFAGTGTTLAAAQDLGRDAIGVDIDESNAWLARERCGMFLDVEHHVPPVVDVATELL